MYKTIADMSVTDFLQMMRTEMEAVAKEVVLQTQPDKLLNKKEQMELLGVADGRTLEKRLKTMKIKPNTDGRVWQSQINKNKTK